MSDLQKAEKLGAKQVYIEMNSPGGWLEPSFEIYNFLKTYAPEVTICNIGEVSSSAIIIYLGCKNRCCLPKSNFLIHQIVQVFDESSRFTLNELKKTTRGLEADITKYSEILDEKTTSLNNKNLSDYLLEGGITLNSNMARETNLCNCDPPTPLTLHEYTYQNTELD